MTVLEAGSSDIIVTYPDERLDKASLKMLRAGVGRLPVVQRGDAAQIVGYLGRTGILAARQHAFDEEQVHEPGWLSRRRDERVNG